MLKFVFFLIFINFIKLKASDVRIVNGIDADEGEFPFAVSLRRNGHHTCGATILNRNFILTAAHCVCNDKLPLDPKNYSIQYGLTKITTENINTIPVEAITCNDFSKSLLIFDSAVLKLTSPLPDGDSWQPVTISKEFDTGKRQDGTIIGWGKLSHNGSLSSNLQKLNVTIYDHRVCKSKYDPNHHICLGAENAGACNGDSGTALLVGKVQVGIASFITAKCGIAVKEHPNVYSRVATYYDWIVGIAGDVISSNLR